MSSKFTPSSCDRHAVALCVALVAAFSGAGCQRRSDPPEVQGARAAVVRYNDRLPAAFRANDQTLLGEAASEAETNRVGAIIAGLAARGEVMIARLVDLRVERASVQSPERVDVTTVETWRYEHRAAADPSSPVTPQERTYRMEYHVGLSRGVWQVFHAAVETESPKSPSP